MTTQADRLPPATPAASAAAAADVISATIDRERHTILVVDDNPATCYATARTLRAAGFRTQEAGTGVEALRCAKGAVSAVVLDVDLPDMDGFDVCRALRADLATAALPVIHLSAAFVQDRDRVTGLNAGADAYLVHPAEPAVLIATLQALIRARMAEENLRRSELRFRTIYTQAPNGIALVDAAGNFADVNPALATLLGRPHDHLVGHGIRQFAPAEWSEFVARQLTGPATEQDTMQVEFPLLHADGHEVMLAWNLSAHTQPGLRVGVATDISERRELETRRQELLEREQAARAMAERHSRTKDDFVAVLSHELRTPLNAIAGWVHLLTRHGDRPDLLSKGLQAIDRSVKAQTRILSDILDVSRVNAGKLRLYREWIDPAELVTSSIDAVQESIAAKQIQLQWNGDAPQPSAWLDPTRFQQIVWNLVSNAIKFSNVGGIVRVELVRTEDDLALTVQDFGKGIAPDFIEHLFDRFTQSDAPDNRLHGGLGLGLSIVQRLVDLHGGSVQAESAGLGFGATLRVTLPAIPGEGDPSGSQAYPSDLPASAGTGEPVLRGLDILVVEDNADAAEMLSLVLHQAGATVRMAGDYDGALAAAGQRWPTVLLSDIGLSGRDGYDLVRTLRRTGLQDGKPAFFAIALTAFSRAKDRQKAFDAGFDRHLAKPLDAQAVVAAIAARSAPGPLRP